MNPDETGTSSPQDNDLDMTNNETPASHVQTWLDRPPSTLKSNVFSAVSGASSDPLTESLAPQPLIEKIAIPRGSNSGLWTSNGRVSRACDTCREQKVKCSGHRPACQRCREGDFTCIYTDRKREREVKFSGPVSQKYLMHEWLTLYSDNLPISCLRFGCTRIFYAICILTSNLNWQYKLRKSSA